MDVYDFGFDRYVGEARHQIAHLRDLTSNLKLQHTPSLVDRLVEGIQRGLERLNQLPRTDPFWLGTNHLPTTFKLADLCRAALTEARLDMDLAWAHLAIAALMAGPHLPQSLLWKAEASRHFPTEWLAEASWIEYCNWGTEVPMMPVARSLGRNGELAELLKTLSQADDESVRTWANYELGS